MNIWQIIVAKVSAFLIVIGIISPVQPPEIIYNVPNNQEVIEMSILEENSPADEYVITVKPKAPAPTQTPTESPAETPKMTPQIIQVHIPHQAFQLPIYTPPPQAPIQQSEPIVTTTPKQIMNTLKIINPYAGKGLGRTYKANPEIVDESNYIDIGLTVVNENGEYLSDLTVQVSATDESQNKTLNGTGNVTNIYPNGEKKTVHYYPFHYEFKTAGEHIITFTQGNLTESVTLQVSE